jgi:Amt family ammonium transporter
VILKIAGVFGGLRVSDDDEVEGLDIAQHGERGYHNS